MLADRLKMPIKDIMKLSVLELDIWSAFIKREQEQASKQMRKDKLRRR
jgi:hypothetical protein